MKTPSSISSSLALCLALALPCVSTSALADQTAFDTITGSTVETWGNWFGYRASMNDNTVVAYRFVSQATGYVTGLSATISLQDAPGTVGLSLYADNAGEVGSFIRALPVQSAGWRVGAQFAEGSYTGGPTASRRNGVLDRHATCVPPGLLGSRERHPTLGRQALPGLWCGRGRLS